MSEYIRSTRECTPDQLTPMLTAAIRAHLAKYDLDADERTARCYESSATRNKRGLFRSSTETIITGIMLTSKYLVWATMKDGEPPVALSARLADLTVQDYERSEMFRLVSDTGVNIFGLRTDSVDLGSTFIGLGPEPAAIKFRSELKDAVRAAQTPATPSP